MSYRISLAGALAVILTACGGGGGNNTLTPTPVPLPVPTPPPVIATVGPASTTAGVVTTFTVSGTHLTAGTKFDLAGCADTTELAGGTNLVRQYSCKPGFTCGPHAGTISATPAATTPLFSYQVDERSPVMSFDSTGSRNAAVTPDGSLYVWGSSLNQGNGAGATVLPPTKIGVDFSSVTVGSMVTFAIKKDGTLWVWGSGSQGLLGTGTDYASVLTPSQIGTGFKKVVLKGENTTAGASVTALKTDGSIWVWGARSSPTPESPAPELQPRMIATGFADISTGPEGMTYAIKADGTFWTWNRNMSPTPFLPTQAGQGYIAITSEFSADYGLRADGTLWGWGYNAMPRPVSVPPTIANPSLVGSGYKSVSSGVQYTVALKEDGTLWAGGSNDQGQFGDGLRGGAPTLKQVGQGYIAVVAGNGCTLAQKPDATLWATGSCDFGDGVFPPGSLVMRKVPGL